MAGAISAAFSLYPTVNPDALTRSMNISAGCLDALGTTISCNEDLLHWTVTVDDHWWETEHFAALSFADYFPIVAMYRSMLQSACVSDIIAVRGKLVPSASVTGRSFKGFSNACLESISSKWYQVESQNSVGLDVVRPDIKTYATACSCSDWDSYGMDENTRLASLYSNDMLCSDWSFKLDCWISGATPIIPSNIATSLAATATVSGGATATTTTATVETPTATYIVVVSIYVNFTEATSGNPFYSIATNSTITLIDLETWSPDVGSVCATSFC